jgi:hypothetical protein
MEPMTTTRRRCRWTLSLVPLLLGLQGCIAGHTFVIEPPEAPRPFQAASVREGESRVTLPPALKHRFEQTLMTRLEKDAALPRGEGLTLEYRFVLHDPGSGAARFGAALVSLTGVPTGALGAGTVGVEVTYKDAAGRPLARILADGPIDGPFGSTQDGLATAAKSIAAYTRTAFAPSEDAPAAHPMRITEASGPDRPLTVRAVKWDTRPEQAREQ